MLLPVKACQSCVPLPLPPETGIHLGVASHGRERPPLRLTRPLSHPLECGQGRPSSGKCITLPILADIMVKTYLFLLKKVINCHPDTIYSMSFNRSGSLVATTCKDKQLRVIQPRTGEVVNQVGQPQNCLHRDFVLGGQS